MKRYLVRMVDSRSRDEFPMEFPAEDLPQALMIAMALSQFLDGYHLVDDVFVPWEVRELVQMPA